MKFGGKVRTLNTQRKECAKFIKPRCCQRVRYLNNRKRAGDSLSCIYNHLSSNMIRTLYDELDPLLREAERQAHTGELGGRHQDRGAIADAVYDSQDVLTPDRRPYVCFKSDVSFEMVQKMAQLKDLPLMLEELSGVRNELETILQIENRIPVYAVLAARRPFANPIPPRQASPYEAKARSGAERRSGPCGCISGGRTRTKKRKKLNRPFFEPPVAVKQNPGFLGPLSQWCPRRRLPYPLCCHTPCR